MYFYGIMCVLTLPQIDNFQELMIFKKRKVNAHANFAVNLVFPHSVNKFIGHAVLVSPHVGHFPQFILLTLQKISLSLVNRNPWMAVSSAK